MDMPVRVRQVPPPRECLEIKTTVDVSRNGIMFRTREAYELNGTIWITMPYNPQVERESPEFPATVVRLVKTTEGDLEVGVQFHSAHADRWNHSVYTTFTKPITTTEKREKNRVRMTLPIRVRTGANWEESVTLDVSRTGVLFVSSHPYTIGQRVFAVLPYQPTGLISGSQAEEPAEVVRFVERAGVRGVAIRFTARAEKPSFV
jgi:hypothetical protein